MKTNYAGFVYWGEFPLNFAAVLDQEECYRLILNKGANHDLQDTNGNTITHIMVVYDNIKMFDLAVECGAAINILNNQQLTALSMASFLAHTDMFFHIANIEREVYWQIGRENNFILYTKKRECNKNMMFTILEKIIGNSF